MMALLRRRLAQATSSSSGSDSAAVVQVQLTGASANATTAIGAQLGQVVTNSALQVCTLPDLAPSRTPRP